VKRIHSKKDTSFNFVCKGAGRRHPHTPQPLLQSYNKYVLRAPQSHRFGIRALPEPGIQASRAQGHIDGLDEPQFPIVEDEVDVIRWLHRTPPPPTWRDPTCVSPILREVANSSSYADIGTDALTAVITTKHKNDESNPSQNCVQHEKQLCRHLMEEATVYSRMGLAKDRIVILLDSLKFSTTVARIESKQRSENCRVRRPTSQMA
jgi:hypothetical protein